MSTDRDPRPPAASTLLAAAHDIGNALGGLVGMVQLARMLASSPTQRRYLEMAEFNGRTLDALLKRALREAQGGAGAGPARDGAGPVPLDTVLVDALRAASAGMGWRDFALVYDHQGPVADVRGLELDLWQVVVNLASNAARHTERGHVGLTARVEPDGAGRGHCTLVVEDTGSGIAPERLARLFEPYAATDPGRRAQGHGLGMAIVQRLVHCLGGTVEVRSEPGVGTRVTLHFTAPLADAAAPPAAGPAGEAWLVYAAPHQEGARWLQRRLARHGWGARIVDGVAGAQAEAARRQPPQRMLVAAHSLGDLQDLQRLQALPHGDRPPVLLTRLDWRQPALEQAALEAGWAVIPVPLPEFDLLALTR